jgi:hypothetical protein
MANMANNLVVCRLYPTRSTVPSCISVRLNGSDSPSDVLEFILQSADVMVESVFNWVSVAERVGVYMAYSMNGGHPNINCPGLDGPALMCATHSGKGGTKFIDCDAVYTCPDMDRVIKLWGDTRVRITSLRQSAKELGQTYRDAEERRELAAAIGAVPNKSLELFMK